MAIVPDHVAMIRRRAGLDAGHPVGAPRASWTTAANVSPWAASAIARTPPGPVCQPIQSGENHAKAPRSASGPAGAPGRRHHAAIPAPASAHPAVSSAAAAPGERPA